MGEVSELSSGNVNKRKYVNVIVASDVHGYPDKSG